LNRQKSLVCMKFTSLFFAALLPLAVSAQCPSASAISVATHVCVGSTATASDTLSGGAWFTSDPTIATVDGGGNVTGVAQGTVVITYAVSRPCGTSSAVTIVTVDQTADVITGNDSVATGETITLSNTTPSGTWTSSESSIATISEAGVVTGAATGTTTITYSVVNSCGTSSATATVNVTEGTSGTTTTTAVSGPTASESIAATSTAHATIGATTLTATITAAPIYTAPAATFTPSATREMKSGKATTSVKNVVEAASVSMYPNPARNQVTINIPAPENTEAQITVIDMCGRVVLQSAVTLSEGGNSHLMDVSNLTAGNYIVSIVAGGNNTTERLTIAK
jgi:Secretion system C-terminal sorting domain/Bacterial Ig-like domain (group 2)